MLTWPNLGMVNIYIVPFWNTLAAHQARLVRLTIGILPARLRPAKIRAMARPNSPSMPTRLIKKALLGRKIITSVPFGPTSPLYLI